MSMKHTDLDILFDAWLNNSVFTMQFMKTEDLMRLAFEAGAKIERDACAKVCRDLADGHKSATGECEHGCDFVAAWETAAQQIIDRSTASTQKYNKKIVIS